MPTQQPILHPHIWIKHDSCLARGYNLYNFYYVILKYGFNIRIYSE